MDYGERLKASFSQFWKSPALLSVLLLEFILMSLLGLLFFVGDVMLLAYLNKAALQAMPMGAFDWHALLNAKTIIFGGALILIQGLIFLYMDSFFKAGFYGMAKNAVQDGSTVFAEFVPSAKRHWHAFFRFLLLRYALTLLILSPFIVTVLIYLATPPVLITAQQTTLLAVTFGAGLALLVLVFFWLLYAEAVIVFDDAGAWQAAKDSMRFANSRIGASISALLTFLGLIALSVAISALLVMPLDYAAFVTQSRIWGAAREVTAFILNIVTVAATVIASLFVFYTYQGLTVEPAARKAGVAKAQEPARKPAMTPAAKSAPRKR